MASAEPIDQKVNSNSSSSSSDSSSSSGGAGTNNKTISPLDNNVPDRKVGLFNPAASSSSEKQPSNSSSSSSSSSSSPLSSNVIHHHQQIRVQQPEPADDDDSNDEDGSNNGIDSAPTTTSSSSVGGSHAHPLLFSRSICSPANPYPSLVSPQNKSNPFATSSTTSSFRPLLRPSAFKLLAEGSSSSSASAAPASTPFVLRPPKLLTGSKEPGPGSVAQQGNSSKPPAAPQFVPLEKDVDEENAGKEEQADVLQQQQESSNAAASAFVFGKNLSERVVDGGGGGGGGVKRKVDTSDDSKDELKKRVVDGGATPEEFPRRDVQVITGEENEVNVLQLGCRLFIFDPQKSTWVERGRGLLRLNESKPSEEAGSSRTSRLIIRTKGSLRVMLNTKVWEGMRVEKAGEKSVRIMAVDLEQQQQQSQGNSSSNNSTSEEDPGLRIFLIQLTSISDAFTLASELTSRVQKLVQDQQKQ